MGVLYLARRIGPAGFSRPVAIKVIHDHLAANKRFARMFVDEAKLSARIDDPNVVRVEEFGQADGRYYLVMEYVHGASLAQAIAVLRKRGRIPMELAVAMAMQIAGGLHGAHEATDEEGVPLGIVHRDVSPHNVIVSYKGTVRVIDFGIAKARQVGGQTKTGSLRGKLAYMPPEQARSARTVDRRADLYGVGLVLWEMLTFRRVFDAETDIAILNQIREPDIIPPSALVPDVPKALDDIIMRTLANDPAARPATGAQLQRDLADALPAALRVLPGDLAALMQKVRVAAEAVAGKSDDPSAMYGEEVRGTLRTFGASMHDSVELADALDTRPSSPDLGATERDLSVAVSGLPPPPSVPIIEDETTMKRTAPIRSSAAAIAIRPGDGVRPIMGVGSSPDLLVPPPPHSSARALGDMRAPMTSSPDMGSAAEVGSLAPRPARLAGLAGLEPRQKVMLAVGAPLLVAFTVAFAIIAGGPRDPRPSPETARPLRDAAAPARSAAAVPEAPTLVAPVVIAPPEINDDSADGGTPGEAASAGLRGATRAKKPRHP